MFIFVQVINKQKTQTMKTILNNTALIIIILLVVSFPFVVISYFDILGGSALFGIYIGGSSFFALLFAATLPKTKSPYSNINNRLFDDK